MKISWLVLTFNRANCVEKAMAHNIASAGTDWHELVWVDNGSTDHMADVMSAFHPDVALRFQVNRGVAHGYNRAIQLSSGDHLVITGCDMLMPDGWLKTMKDHLEAIPETGVMSIYCAPLDRVPERVRGKPEALHGRQIVRAMPMGRRIFSREFLMACGYFREDFGLYGWEDVEWGYRAERLCEERGLVSYTVPGLVARHLGGETDSPEYRAWKKAQASDPAKHELMERCRAEGWPYYNPFS